MTVPIGYGCLTLQRIIGVYTDSECYRYFVKDYCQVNDAVSVETCQHPLDLTALGFVRKSPYVHPFQKITDADKPGKAPKDRDQKTPAPGMLSGLHTLTDMA